MCTSMNAWLVHLERGYKRGLLHKHSSINTSYSIFHRMNQTIAPFYQATLSVVVRTSNRKGLSKEQITKHWPELVP